VARYPEAPPGFECPYRDRCPHLGGLSTAWVFHEYQDGFVVERKYWRVRDEYEAQLQEQLVAIQSLERENAELRARLTALHRRQFKAGKKRRRADDQPCGCDRQGGAQDPRKRRGAPRGHPGWRRPGPDRVDEEVVVPAPERCPHCGSEQLVPSDEMREHVQEDIVLQPRTWVTNFKHHQAVCPRCHRVVVQAAHGELLGSRIGPVTKSAAVFLRYGMRLSYRKVQELLEVFFGMPCVPASVMNFDRQATAKGEPLYEDLKHKLRACPIVYADETHWRQDGRNGFVWYGGNEQVALFHIDPSRSAAVAVRLLGDEFGGSLVTDGYAAYNAVNASSRQSCLAHLIRKAKEISQAVGLDPEGHRDHDALRFCTHIARAFTKACQMGAKRADGSLSPSRAARLVPRLYSLVDSICSTPLKHQQAETFRRRILDPRREYDRLFTFLSVPGLAPTNNHAEQALRTPVIFRKICFGTRSPEGSRSHSVLPSLLLTAQRQGHHPLSFFQTLFCADTATAQAALYNNSNDSP
jgi:transposase